MKIPVIHADQLIGFLGLLCFGFLLFQPFQFLRLCQLIQIRIEDVQRRRAVNASVQRLVALAFGKHPDACRMAVHKARLNPLRRQLLEILLRIIRREMVDLTMALFARFRVNGSVYDILTMPSLLAQ